MASQNERYRKVLQEKLEILQHQHTEVISFVTSLVDKATESTQQFLKVSTDSKKFRKKYQEANTSLDAALDSLLKISNACGSSNDDSDSSSGAESDTELSKRQDKVSVNINVTSSQRTVSFGEPPNKEEGSPPATSVQSPPVTQNAGKKEASPPQQPSLSHEPTASSGPLRRPNIAQVAKHSPPRARTQNNMSQLKGAPLQALLHVDTPGNQIHHHLPQTTVGAPLPHQSSPLPSPPMSQSSTSSVNQSQSTPRIPLLSPRSGDKIEAVISHVVSPSLFWIQDTQSCVRNLVEQMNNFYCQGNIPIPIPKPDLVCCARFSDDGGWYRAKILGVQTPQQPTLTVEQLDTKVQVYFIDYGNSEVTSVRNLRLLHKMFTAVPPLALCCRLSGVVPPNKHGQWTSEGNMFFNAVCLGKGVQVEITHPKLEPQGVPSVRVCCYENKELEGSAFREEMVDVAKLLVQKGLAKYAHEDILAPTTATKSGKQKPSNNDEPAMSELSFHSGLPCEVKTAAGSGPKEGKDAKAGGEQVIPEGKKKERSQESKKKSKTPTVSQNSTNSKMESTSETTKKEKRDIASRPDLPITEGRLLMAMSFIVHPNDFYVHLITPNVLEFDVLYDRLQEHYNDSANAVGTDNAKRFGVGDYCCAKFEKDSCWYRGKILEVRSLGPKGKRKWDFMVFYLDYGNMEWILENNVKPLAEEFYGMPAQAVRCSLAYLSPFVPAGNKDSNAKWTDQAIKLFSKLTGFETKLYGFVVSVPEDKSKAIDVNLTISTSHMEVYVNQELVNLGLASSEILKRDSEEDDELEIASSKWLEHRYSEGGYGDSDTGLPDSPDSLMDALEKVDPMAVHYDSEINTYNFDRDDPEMATMGYKSNLDKKVCYYHVSGKGCYRGDNCPYEHPDPVPCKQNYYAEMELRKRPPKKVPKCTKAHAIHQWLGLPCPNRNSSSQDFKYEVKDTTDCFCTNHVVDLLPDESIVCVLITAMLSPIHFWVQFVYGPRPLDHLHVYCSESLERPWEEGETLELLNEAINKNCKKEVTKNHDMTILALGEIVLAKHGKDNNWYRARVTFVDEDKIEVFHVDYGTSEWVKKRDVKPALPQFLHLPFQAVQCKLHGLEETETCKEERENAWNYFEEIAAGVPLVAFVIERGLDNLLFVDLYNTVSSEKDISISKALIAKGYYRRQREVA